MDHNKVLCYSAVFKQLYRAFFLSSASETQLEQVLFVATPTTEMPRNSMIMSPDKITVILSSTKENHS